MVVAEQVVQTELTDIPLRNLAFPDWLASEHVLSQDSLHVVDPSDPLVFGSETPRQIVNDARTKDFR